MNDDINNQIAQLRNTISKMEIVFNSIDEAVVWANKNGNIQWCNTSFDKLTQHTHINLLGKNILDILDFLNLGTSNIKKGVNLLNAKKDEWSIDEFSYSRKGKKYFLQISVKIFKSLEGEKSFIIIIRDITEQKMLQSQLEHLAHYDLLTNLPNRRQFETFLTRELSKSKRYNRKFSLLFIDVNDFKYVNDTYGHQVGDQLLKILSEKLKRQIRIDDFVARIGGDEFTVIITEIKDYDLPEQLVQKIRKSLNTSYMISGNKISSSISIGIANYPEDGSTERALLHVADTRMYQEK